MPLSYTYYSLPDMLCPLRIYGNKSLSTDLKKYVFINNKWQFITKKKNSILLQRPQFDLICFALCRCCAIKLS